MDHTSARTAREELSARRLPVGVRRFLATEAASGLALIAAAVVALVWANSPWGDTYETVWHTAVDLRVGTIGVEQDLRHVVNDGLMALFFVVVAIEVKRELVSGELRDPRAAALPAIAAAGGMIAPAAIYLAVNRTGEPAAGWGIPMATDIAFALGVLALLGSRVPANLKLFLLSLAIVDDIGTIAVIAVFYTDDIDATGLTLAVAAIAGAAGLRWARVWWPPAFVALGLGCWLAMYNSGIHPTLAGVAFGLLAPTRPLAPTEVAKRWASDLSDEPSAAELREMTTMARETVSVAERVQHTLHPITSYAVVPVFALGNAGVALTADALDAPGTTTVVSGVILGLVAGIGFTVSLFVTGLAFDDTHLQHAARLAVLAASILASLLGAAILHHARRPT